MEFDVTSYFNTTVRLVEDASQDGHPAKAAVIRCVYQTGISDLWEAVTSPDRLARWFLPVSGELRAGGRYQLQGNAGGEIVVCDPPRALSLTWEFGGDKSWVELHLKEEPGNSTSFELRHIALLEGDRWTQFGPGAVGVGWDVALLGLQSHISTAAPIDKRSFAVWSGGDSGKDFMRTSSEQWRDASVESGTDVDAADAAAARTTAFYIGAPRKK